ncbi:MAG: ABC transporter substrate-binding protein, partial [Haloechinothrix sp.]
MSDKHRLGLTAALTALAVVAAGCGGDGGGGDGSGDGGLGSITVAVGTAQTFEFLPAEYGLDLGVWGDRGLQVENLYVQGSGQVAQAIAAGEADIGLTAGASGVDAILSGVESKIVGLIGADFRMMVLVVPEDTTIQSIGDLDGAVVGVTSAGSLTDYLARTITVHQGWPEDAIQRANIGGLSEQLAALESGATDAFVWSVEAGFALEEEGRGRVLLDFGEIVTGNVFEDIVASQPAIDEREDAVRAYLEGWYETVRHMKDNRDETIAKMVEEFEVSENVAAKTYDHDIDNLSTDGSIPQANLEGLAQSVVEQGIVDEVPDIGV